MVSGKYSALSGAITREQSIANTSANLANVSTVGYKKTRMSFESMLRGEKQILDAKGINYNRVSGNYVDFSQGPIQQTDNPLDVAIMGDGFFKVRGPEGDLLTRNGHFQLDAAGQLQTDTGLAVVDVGGGEITIQDADTNKIVVDNAGIIYTVDSNGEQSQISQLAIVDVDDRSQLQQAKDTSYSLAPGMVETLPQNTRVSQGSLEISNVNMTEEMAKMINDNRIYQTYHNVLKSYSTLGEKLGELGSLG